MRFFGIFAATLATFIPALAAVNTTTIAGKVLLPSGSAATGGTIVCELSQPGSVDVDSTSQRVATRIATTISSLGAVSFTLVPNDIIMPSGTYYTCRFATTGASAASWTEKWQVDSTPDPVEIGAVTRLDSTPAAGTSYIARYSSASIEANPACAGELIIGENETGKIYSCGSGSEYEIRTWTGWKGASTPCGEANYGEVAYDTDHLIHVICLSGNWTPIDQAQDYSGVAWADDGYVQFVRPAANPYMLIDDNFILNKGGTRPYMKVSSDGGGASCYTSAGPDSDCDGTLDWLDPDSDGDSTGTVSASSLCLDADGTGCDCTNSSPGETSGLSYSGHTSSFLESYRILGSTGNYWSFSTAGNANTGPMCQGCWPQGDLDGAIMLNATAHRSSIAQNMGAQFGFSCTDAAEGCLSSGEGGVVELGLVNAYTPAFSLRFRVDADGDGTLDIDDFDDWEHTQENSSFYFVPLYGTNSPVNDGLNLMFYDFEDDTKTRIGILPDAVACSNGPSLHHGNGVDTVTHICLANVVQEGASYEFNGGSFSVVDEGASVSADLVYANDFLVINGTGVHGSESEYYFDIAGEEGKDPGVDICLIPDGSDVNCDGTADATDTMVWMRLDLAAGANVGMLHGITTSWSRTYWPTSLTLVSASCYFNEAISSGANSTATVTIRIDGSGTPLQVSWDCVASGCAAYERKTGTCSSGCDAADGSYIDANLVTGAGWDGGAGTSDVQCVVAIRTP